MSVSCVACVARGVSFHCYLSTVYSIIGRSRRAMPFRSAAATRSTAVLTSITTFSSTKRVRGKARETIGCERHSSSDQTIGCRVCTPHVAVVLLAPLGQKQTPHPPLTSLARALTHTVMHQRGDISSRTMHTHYIRTTLDRAELSDIPHRSRTHQNYSTSLHSWSR